MALGITTHDTSSGVVADMIDRLGVILLKSRTIASRPARRSEGEDIAGKRFYTNL
jgi:hypothetical protein